ncbi:hypothetical protein KKF32_05085 [Patescibacteria group bacterium]|nr:hypothetical protein [Patescibacteria group bacterium]
MATITIVTHGEMDDSLNPGHLTRGMRQVEALKQFLPEKPAEVHFGNSRRYIEMVRLLSLSLEELDKLPENFYSCEAVGSPTSFKDERIWKFILELPDNSLILAGSPLMKTLLKLAKSHEVQDLPDARSASVYKVAIDDGEIVDVKHLFSAEDIT